MTFRARIQVLQGRSQANKTWLLLEVQVELRRNHTGVKIVLLTGQFHAYKCKDFVCLYLAQPWQKPLGFAAVKFGVAKKVSSLVALNPTTFIPRLWLVHIIVDRKKVSKCQKAVGRKFTDYSGKQSFYCRYFEMKARVHILFEKNYRITICLTAKKMFTWRSKTKKCKPSCEVNRQVCIYK